MHTSLMTTISHLSEQIRDIEDTEMRERFERALRYALGTTTKADAVHFVWRMEDLAEMWTVTAISPEDIEVAFDGHYKIPTDKQEWAKGTCADIARYISKKYQNDFCTSGINSWAIEELEERAKNDGVELIAA